VSSRVLKEVAGKQVNVEGEGLFSGIHGRDKFYTREGGNIIKTFLSVAGSLDLKIKVYEGREGNTRESIPWNLGTLPSNNDGKKGNL